MEEKKRFLLNFTFWSAVILIVYVFLNFFFKSFFPVLLSFVIAVMVQKPSNYISTKLKLSKRLTASFLGVSVYILTALILGLGFYFLLKISRNLMEEFPNFAQVIRDAVLGFKEKISGVFSKISPEFSAQADKIIGETAEGILKKTGDFASNILGKVAKDTPSILFNSLISVVACSYIAKDYHKLLKFFRNLFGIRVFENAVKIKQILVNSVFRILKGYLKLALVTFAVLVAVFWFISVKGFYLIALIVAFVDLLPVLGAGTVLLPWGIIDIAFGNVKRGIIIFAAYAVITLLKNFLEPKIIARQVGINPLFMLISIFVGLKFLGVFGAFLLPISIVVLYEFYSDETDQSI